MVVLRMEGVKVKRNKKIVLDISELELKEGETLCLSGPNGAGKTTLLLFICGLAEDCNGRIFFKGREVGKEISFLEYRRRVTMVFQEPLLFNTSVFENVASGLKIRGLKKKEIERRVEKYLHLFKISDLKERKAHTLSGGEAQRVSLARAFVLDPDILLLDEPFSSLDPETKDSLINDLLRLKKTLKMSIIFTTHNSYEAYRLSDRVCVLKEGKIVKTANPKNEWFSSSFCMDKLNTYEKDEFFRLS